MTREEARNLPKEYNTEPFPLKHAPIVGDVMRYFAAGCSKEVVERGAQMLGWEPDRLIERAIFAMRSREKVYENFQEA